MCFGQMMIYVVSMFWILIALSSKYILTCNVPLSNDDIWSIQSDIHVIEGWGKSHVCHDSNNDSNRQGPGFWKKCVSKTFLGKSHSFQIWNFFFPSKGFIFVKFRDSGFIIQSLKFQSFRLQVLELLFQV